MAYPARIRLAAGMMQNHFPGIVQLSKYICSPHLTPIGLSAGYRHDRLDAMYYRQVHAGHYRGILYIDFHIGGAGEYQSPGLHYFIETYQRGLARMDAVERSWGYNGGEC